MTAEDDLSMKSEVFNHKQRFAQKDEPPPDLPSAFTDNGLNGFRAGPLAYR